ncbi:hypothetical protein PR048_015165 [Dryococelus australis]|uniref:Uncharacterized protein n=1 Tax=Dryococelus australis TaxID=614101 RepID=A0ABQ9HG59_9NEOP|nr:hypothetical protein PR048_015165 [Dryococelus australis]
MLRCAEDPSSQNILAHPLNSSPSLTEGRRSCDASQVATTVNHSNPPRASDGATIGSAWGEGRSRWIPPPPPQIRTLHGALISAYQLYPGTRSLVATRPAHICHYLGRGKREIPEKTRRRTASPGAIPTCENLVTRLWLEARVLIAQPPRPLWIQLTVPKIKKTAMRRGREDVLHKPSPVVWKRGRGVRVRRKWSRLEKEHARIKNGTGGTVETKNTSPTRSPGSERSALRCLAKSVELQNRSALRKKANQENMPIVVALFSRQLGRCLTAPIFKPLLALKSSKLPIVQILLFYPFSA